MAKRQNDQTPQRSNSSLRVRWVEVELNGSDTSIEEALRTIERIRRPVVDAPPKRIASAATPTDSENAPSDEPTSLDGEDQTQADATTTGSASDSNGEGNSDSSASRKKRGEGDPKDYNAGIKLVGDINFVPAGKKSLKELFVEKVPSSDMEQILAICYFLQHTAEADKFGPGHILSGLKHVGKPVPKDLKSTIRNMKSKKAWINFTDIESIRLTTEGDNRIEHELGKGTGDG